ncbi:hypothetical protein Metli_1460 [Methanofollis liminatans DSM 4140]|uniref:DUF4013 domain-containing protein n=1 Tax=Methanofollis liminatans DSM 4140 TaxID=28892 RepID=J0S0P0_9EURY|nr:DUF4013 domain-containing protein [Methanofollis liminatans]EJG07411.1 hypothetical protein Metli_1460 [Methanofollis liminatans DSM 4140]
MDYGSMLGNAFEYAKEAVMGKWVKWILLIISSIIFPLIMGYMMEIYRGKDPAPELENWGKLFIDGIKLFIVELIYAIPLILVAMIFFGGSIALMAGGQGSDALMGAGIGMMLIGLIIFIILAIAIGLIAIFGGIRFARTDSFGEAFNIRAIMAHIGSIGWLDYIIALIIIYVVVGVINIVLGMIPLIGWLISLVIMPVLSIFAARYMTQIYESASAPA